jgi:threonine dehydrogenase-like Zn-dependent dehydrogenase
MELTGGRGADVALDVAPRTPQPFLDAVDAVRTGGTIVVAGIKDNATPAALNTNRLVYKELTVRGVITQGVEFYQRALDLLGRELETFKPLHTHEMPLARVGEAVEMLAGASVGARAISISVHP